LFCSSLSEGQVIFHRLPFVTTPFDRDFFIFMLAVAAFSFIAPASDFILEKVELPQAMALFLLMGRSFLLFFWQ
jgi:hypothetical protein